MIQLRWVAIDKQAYAKMPAPLGRLGIEQATLVAMLQDDRLYRAEDVAATGYRQGSQAFLSAFRAFSRLSRRSGLNETFENRNHVAGEGYAWSGRSWKRALGQGMARIAVVMEELEQKQRREPDQLFFLQGSQVVGQSMAPIRVPTACPGVQVDPPKSSTGRQWPWHVLWALALAVTWCSCCWRC